MRSVSRSKPANELAKTSYGFSNIPSRCALYFLLVANLQRPAVGLLKIVQMFRLSFQDVAKKRAD